LIWRRSCVMSIVMACTTIALTQPAYERLKKQKLPGESFSDVVLREIQNPCETCGDVLDSLKQKPVPEYDSNLLATMLAGRGRRSKRVPVSLPRRTSRRKAA
jgi:predicted CopG family antitoxin